MTLEPGPFKATHRHYKGGLYQVLLNAFMEVDLAAVVVYRGSNGYIWVRPAHEFAKKFERIK
jgi:hypothetical protein